MAKATSRSLRLPWRVLPRAMSSRSRAALVRSLGGLLTWQRRLDGWPAVVGASDATPFVSLYARGRLVGCVGAPEGSPGERVARAFLRALHDPRDEARADDRAAMSAELSYVAEARRLPGDPSRALAALEVGTHGLAWVASDPSRSVLLLPQVARDHGWTAATLFDALCQKARMRPDEIAGGALYRLSAETVVAHGHESIVDGTPAALARRWLEARVADDGSIEFAVDPARGERFATGPMHHGRAAVVVEALTGSRLHARAARRLAADITAALRGDPPPGWPDDEAMIAGTIALAVRAGLPFADALLARAASPKLVESAWHAAQAVAALGERAPASLWASCIADLARRPFAPWTAIAAVARGDHATYARTATTLCAAIDDRGGVANGASVPEVALTAITVEALAAGRSSRESVAAIARGRGFLSRWQNLRGKISASLDPRIATGAFPVSPVVAALRSDVTAHALLALGPRFRRG